MKINPQLKQDLITYIKDRMKNKAKPRITVTATYELSTEELESLTKKIGLLQSAEIQTKVDPSILAGIVITYGSQVIDLSLKSELHKLENTLYETA